MKSVIVAACAALLLSGCSGDDETQDGPKGPALVTMPVSKSVLMVGGPVRETGEELLKGKPAFVNGCLGATSGDKNYLVVWPDGTNVAGPDTDAVRFGDEVLEPGQSFTGKGALVDTKAMPQQFPDIPLKCLGPNEELIMWVHEITEISGSSD